MEINARKNLAFALLQVIFTVLLTYKRASYKYNIHEYTGRYIEYCRGFKKKCEAVRRVVNRYVNYVRDK